MIYLHKISAKDMRYLTSLIISLLPTLAIYAQAPICSLPADTSICIDHTIPNPRPLYKIDTLSINMIGDVMMHASQISHSRIHGYDSYLQELQGIYDKADISIANMEFTLAGEPYTGYPAFSAPDGYEDYIADCGTDIFLTANNHIWDKGSQGITRTLKRYDAMRSRGIRHTGSALDKEQRDSTLPLFIRAKGFKIALINFTYGTNVSQTTTWPSTYRMSDKALLSKAISKAIQGEADLIIALPHWGIEYEHRHSKDQEKMAQWLANQGVHLIIGTHPHVIQDYQILTSNKDGHQVPCIYSLGNAISNMKISKTRVELMATIFLTRDITGQVTLETPRLNYLWCTLPGMKYPQHATIPIVPNIGRRSEWQQPSDYDNMLTTSKIIERETGIPIQSSRTNK